MKAIFSTSPDDVPILESKYQCEVMRSEAMSNVIIMVTYTEEDLKRDALALISKTPVIEMFPSKQTA